MPTRNPNLDILSNDATALVGEDRGGWAQNLGQSKIDLSVPRPTDWWTGKPPQTCPGFDGRLRALPQPDLATCTRQQVRDYFDNGWTLTELLFSAANSDEAFYRPPYHGLRHPLIFYYVHPACLYINKFRVAGLINGPIDSLFETLFETGVDEMSWDDMSKNEIVWPLLDQAHAYRKNVYKLVCDLIESHEGLADGHAPVTDQDPLWALFMGFEHERIHLETSSVLMRELPLALLDRPAQFPEPFQQAFELSEKVRELKYESVAAGRVKIGKERDYPTYGWDNEYGRREVDVDEFEVSTTLITNAQFLEFVKDGGYSDNAHWSNEGLRWRQYRNVKWPTFWVLDGPQGMHRYKLRTIFDTVALPGDWPCVVNFHEAKAYCNWLAAREKRPRNGLRLLTEAEHYRLRQVCDLNSGSDSDSLNSANLSLTHGSESSVYAGKGAIKDLFGNVWQWLEDDFHPLPGFRVHPYYDDFSTPCFDGEHKMIVGGSFISAGDEASIHERFHFRPHFFQHAGFRVVRSSPANRGQVVTIQKDSLGRALPVAPELLGLSADAALKACLARKRAVDLRLMAEFGHMLSVPAASGMAWRLLRETPATAALVADVVRKYGLGARTALDVGASLGAVSYELARELEAVVAVELSEPLHERSHVIQKDARIDFEIIQGSISRRVEQSLSRQALDRITFKRADPMSLPAEYQNFDVVVLNDIITQVPSPAALLGRLGGERGLVKSSGLLVILSDFVWGEACDQSLWLGGRLDGEGKIIDSAEEIERQLGDFELLEKRNLPYLELLDSGRALIGEKTLMVMRRR